MRKLDLCLHVGGAVAEREAVAKVETPAATDSWHPIPHIALLDGIQKTVERSGLHVVNEAHALAHEGQRYFGLLQVANGSNPEDYSLVLGIRNAHDKSIQAGLALGSQVFVCDNLAFSGEVVIGRKHTRFIERDLPSLIESAVGRVGEMRRSQDARIETYKRFDLSESQTHDLLIQALDARVVPVTRIPEVLKEWREPSHPEFAKEKNAWRLFNAFTEVLKGSSLFNRPVASQALHGLLDTVCGVTLSKN
jgi:hypothetical protein